MGYEICLLVNVQKMNIKSLVAICSARKGNKRMFFCFLFSLFSYTNRRWKNFFGGDFGL